MKWVTRERPKIDRIACPWLIQRFVEKQPEFLYVPADKVLATAKETGAIPYDEMWADDRHWLPEMLAGRRFRAWFEFDGDRMLSRDVRLED